jgi:rfaE bifunctional protein kinase chain/domain
MIGLKRAKALVSQFRGRRVLVVGDAMLDRYVAGRVTRISPEAPVPVVEVLHEYARPGGAANVAANVQALGGAATVAAIVGDDREGEELAALLRAGGIRTDGLVVRRGRRTTTKMRVLADRQQVVRVDHEAPKPVEPDAIAELCANIRRLKRNADGVIMEDYSKGALTQATVDAAREGAAEAGLAVGYDPKDNRELDVSGIALACPNYLEACVAMGVPFAPFEGDAAAYERLAALAGELKRKWSPESLIVKLGGHGLYLLADGHKPVRIPTMAREVFDVSGAGDTVIATALLALVSGASPLEAASLANYAAGVVVGKVGTACCSPGELLDALEGSQAKKRADRRKGPA